jgi:hypothetical protein
MVLEGSVHGHLALYFWTSGEAEGHGGRTMWRRKLFTSW